MKSNGHPFLTNIVEVVDRDASTGTTYRKLGLGEDDLIQTDMLLKDFKGAVSPARGQFALI